MIGKALQTFRLFVAFNALNKNFALESIENKKVNRILEERRIYQNNIDDLDRKFILVSPSTEGKFTIIDGNHRAIALLRINKLVKNQIYLGISNRIKEYKWVKYTV